MPAFVLPTPTLDLPATFADALRSRRSQREIGGRPLPSSVLSNLLLAARSAEEILLYLALPTGAYRFEPSGHELRAITDVDVRPQASEPSMSRLPPVQLVYVADIARLEHALTDPVVRKSYYFIDAGLIAENVYLFASAQGLACWIHNCDRTALAQSLQLSATERVLFAQTVGYPRTP